MLATLLLLACSTPAPLAETPAEAKTRSSTETLEYAPGLSLDLSLPARAPALYPLVVLFHGGGATRGSRLDSAITLPREDLIAAGFAVASVDYALCDGGDTTWEDQLASGQAALDYLRDEAPGYHLDPDRVGLLGTSWGGWVASMLIEDADALVVWYGVTDLTGTFNGFRVRTQVMVFGHVPTAAEREEASPAYAVLPATAILFHGEEDTLVPASQSEETAAAWGAEYVPVAGASHAWAGVDSDAVVAETVDWFSANL